MVSFAVDTFVFWSWSCSYVPVDLGRILGSIVVWFCSWPRFRVGCSRLRLAVGPFFILESIGFHFWIDPALMSSCYVAAGQCVQQVSSSTISTQVDCVCVLACFPPS